MAAYIGLAVSAIIGGLSASSGKKDAKKARLAEIRRIRMQTAEEIRRRAGRFAQEKSEGLAMAGASGFARGNATEGVAASGGYGKILEDMQKEFNLEIDWLNKSAEAGIDVTDQAYRRTVGNIQYSYANSLVEGFGNLGQAKNWWA